MKTLILVKPQSPDALTFAEKLSAQFNALGAESAVYSWQRETDKEAEGCDVAVSLGGDGTVLYAARMVAPYYIPLLPVNMGTLGFIAAVRSEDALDVFRDWREGKAAVSPRLMLLVNVERGGKNIFSKSCLNDAVISADGIAKTIRLDAALAENETSSIKSGAAEAALDGGLELASYRSDGLIIATPTGSTAYSASAGGPILDPETEALILTPICPFTLLHRPLVIPAGNTLAVSIPGEQRSNIILTIDGQVMMALEPGDRILARQAPFKAHLIASGRTAFYKSLHTKLAWPRPAAL